jgi:hypothetical protein
MKNLNKMKDCTVIIPVIGLKSEKLLKLTKEACESVPKTTQIIIVGCEEDINLIDFDMKNLKKLTHDGDTSYCSQVNFAIDNVTTKYFSILEYDDKFSKNWFKNVERHIKHYDDKLFAFFPLTELIDDETKQTLGYANEAFLASSFSEEMGFMDLDALMDYFGFNASGAIFKTEEFKTIGKLKSSMKLTFWYEFLLRALYKEKKIYVIPKVGCFHLVNRVGSLTNIYNDEMSADEADWWVDLAKKEFYFTNDRNKQYEK